MAIGIGGSGANPPHPVHPMVVKTVMDSGLFGEVIWKPSGERRDKPELVPAIYRDAMTALMFPPEWRYRMPCLFNIDNSDVYGHMETPSILVMEKWQAQFPDEEIWWYTGADSVVPQDKYDGLCEIEAIWHRGSEMMSKNILIIPRAGYPHPSTLGLPSNFVVLDVQLPNLSSSDIVKRIRTGKPWEYLYGDPTHPVVQYIKRHRLYGWKGEYR